MVSLRSFCILTVWAFAIVLAQSAAQLHPIANSPTKPTKSQKEAASASARTPHTKFSTAAIYESAGSYADSVAVADLNGDGKADLAVANYCQNAGPDSCQGYGEVAVLLGNGDGTLQQAVTYSTGAYWANSVAVADVNGDGAPDLIVAGGCQSEGCRNGAVSVLLGNGDGTFQTAVVYDSGGYDASAVVIGDLNRDGKLDLAVSNADFPGADNSPLSVLLGNGDGTFQSAVNYDSGSKYAVSVAIGDFNGDGDPDLVVASSRAGNPGVIGVLLGNGDGTFQPVVNYSSGDESPYSIGLGDLRGDGILDIIVADGQDFQNGNRSPIGVLLGDGDGNFQPVVTYLAKGIQYYITANPDSLAVGDVNGDSIPDVVVVEECGKVKYTYPPGCLETGKINVMLGNGDGTFQKPLLYATGGWEGSAVAIADVNGDGRPDLIVTSSEASQGDYTNGTVAVLLNETSYATKTALSASPNPAQVNQSVTFTATITPTPPNGEVVTFYNGKTSLGTGTTKNGVASLTTSFAAAKTYTIKTNYTGDAFRKASVGTVKVVVNP